MELSHLLFCSCCCQCCNSPPKFQFQSEFLWISKNKQRCPFRSFRICSIFFFLLISTINEGKIPNIRIQHYRRIKTKIEAKKFGKKKDTPTPAPRFGYYRLIVSFISEDQTKSCWRKITKYVRMVIFHYCNKKNLFSTEVKFSFAWLHISVFWVSQEESEHKIRTG